MKVPEEDDEEAEVVLFVDDSSSCASSDLERRRRKNVVSWKESQEWKEKSERRRKLMEKKWQKFNVSKQNTDHLNGAKPWKVFCSKVFASHLDVECIRWKNKSEKKVYVLTHALNVELRT